MENNNNNNNNGLEAAIANHNNNNNNNNDGDFVAEEDDDADESGDERNGGGFEDEEDDEEEDDDDDEEDDDNNVNVPNGVGGGAGGGAGGGGGMLIEGGVGETHGADPSVPRRLSSQADIALSFLCTEPLSFCPDHPVLQIGVTVHIGLDKTCKLSNVFNRYVEVCNEQCPRHKISVSDLEFVHTHVLSGSDTAEVAALMKHDEIKVRRDRTILRQDDVAFARLERDSDKEYYNQMRRLLNFPSRLDDATPDPELDVYADTRLECLGSLDLHPGNNQNRFIKCHSALLYKRCPWLFRKIELGRIETNRDRSSVITVPDESKASINKVMEEEDDTFDLMQKRREEPQPQAHRIFAEAAQIENDDDVELTPMSGGMSGARHDEHEDSRGMRVPDADPGLTFIRVENHSPEVMSLLLEYCYSNRVVPLGYAAFVEACLTKPQYKKIHGPVPPFSLRPSKWPNHGEPSVSLTVAICGIRLAEEAGLPRLSLMCEIAASRLIDYDTTVQALEACSTQLNVSGNALPVLRKAAMEIVFQSHHTLSTGISDLLKPALGPASKLVPTLFTGTMEAVESFFEKKKQSTEPGYPFLVSTGEKRDWKAMAYEHFDKLDKFDTFERDRERFKRRSGMDNFMDHPLDRIHYRRQAEFYGQDDPFDFWPEGEVYNFSRVTNRHGRSGTHRSKKRNSGDRPLFEFHRDSL